MTPPHSIVAESRRFTPNLMLDLEYKKEHLLKLDIEALQEIAKKLHVSYEDNQEKKTLVYKILDAQASHTVAEKGGDQTDKPKSNNPQEEKSAPSSTHNRRSYPRKNNNQGRNNYRNNQYKNAQSENRQPSKTQLNLQKYAALIDGEGVLDLMPEGYGFLRSADYNYLSSPDDIHISHTLVKKWGLLKGDLVVGSLRPPKENEKFFSMLDIKSVNGCTWEELRKRKNFQNLVPIFPEKRFNLSSKPNQYAARLIELFIPIGFGQRSLIIAQPKAGKTTVLKNIANGISENHPQVHLIVLMIGERPEEVTDMQRSVQAEVVASTFDEQHENHIKVAIITIEKAKRMVECGHDVVIILDSLTRLARAFNTSTPSSGKILSGGVDANALHIPKRIFGAARNIENGGSLTIIASALTDTGSRMDEVILEEFTGTGNMELLLSRNLANKGIYPAIDILRSSTRRGEDMQRPEEFKLINMLRRVMGDMKSPEDALDFLLNNMKGTATNEEFLASIRH